MAGDPQRIPFTQAAQRLAERKAKNAIELLGKSLPASVKSVTGSVVTVKFELTNIGFTLPEVTVPIIGSEYIRVPVQAGCKGVVIAIDAGVGAMSGLGPANTDLTMPANLSSLVFVPIGNKSWTVGNPDHLVLYGVDGVSIFDARSNTWEIDLTSTGFTAKKSDNSVSFGWNGTAWEFKGPVIFNNGIQLGNNITAIGGGTYGGNFITSGTIQSGTIVLSTHKHTGVTTGVGTSGGPTP